MVNNIEKVVTIKVKERKNYNESVKDLLTSLSFDMVLAQQKVKKILIKPNLLENVPHPCTTDVECVSAIINFIKNVNSDIEVVVLEGSGGCATSKAFKELGYNELIKKYDVKLLDIDNAQIIKLSNKNALVYKEIYLPEEIFNGFLISVPSLKDHLITTVTLGMKNLIGLLPEKYYGSYWSYKRSDVHRVGVNNAIVDLNTYIKIDMVIIDGRIGQIGSHLPGGRACNPAKNILIGGYDAFKVDCFGAEILGHKWESVSHLSLFNDIIKNNLSKII